MHSRLPSRCAMPLLVLILLLLSACAQTPSAEPPLIARKPKPTPLPAAILRIDLNPSTASLSRGLQWSENSERILSEGMPKQCYCESRLIQSVR